MPAILPIDYQFNPPFLVFSRPARVTMDSYHIQALAHAGTFDSRLPRGKWRREIEPSILMGERGAHRSVEETGLLQHRDTLKTSLYVLSLFLLLPHGQRLETPEKQILERVLHPGGWAVRVKESTKLIDNSAALRVAGAMESEARRGLSERDARELGSRLHEKYGIGRGGNHVKWSPRAFLSASAAGCSIPPVWKGIAINGALRKKAECTPGAAILAEQ